MSPLFKKSKTPAGQNRRRHKRLDAHFLLKYETRTPGTSPRITNIKNISAGGAKFLTQESFPPSATIQVNILIPPLERSFPAKAKIIRVRRHKRKFIYSVAVEFTGIEPKDQEALNQFVETIKAEEAKFAIDHANVILEPK